MLDRTQRAILSVFRSAHDSVASYSDLISAEPVRAAKSDSDDASGGGGAGGAGGEDSKQSVSRRADRDREIDRRKKRRKQRLFNSSAPVIAISTAIREHIERSLVLLIPLLHTRSYLPESLGFAFMDLAHSHLHQLLVFLNTTLLCGTLRDSEGPIYKSPPPNPIADLSAVADNKVNRHRMTHHRLCLCLCLYRTTNHSPPLLLL